MTSSYGSVVRWIDVRGDIQRVKSDQLHAAEGKCFYQIFALVFESGYIVLCTLLS